MYPALSTMSIMSRSMKIHLSNKHVNEKKKGRIVLEKKENK